MSEFSERQFVVEPLFAGSVRYLIGQLGSCRPTVITYVSAKSERDFSQAREKMKMNSLRGQLSSRQQHSVHEVVALDGIVFHCAGLLYIESWTLDTNLIFILSLER